MYEFEFYRPVKIETILKNPNFALEIDADPNNTREGWVFLRYLPNEVHEDNKPYGFYIRCEHIGPTMNSYLQYGEVNSDGHPFQTLEALYEIFGILWCDDPIEVVYAYPYIKDREWNDFMYGICAYYMVSAISLNEDDDMYKSLKPLLDKYDEMKNLINTRSKQLKYKIKILFTNIWVYLQHPVYMFWNISNYFERKKWEKKTKSVPEDELPF